MPNLTVLADENIAGLGAYFAKHDTINLIQTSGRQIPAKIADCRPDALFIRSVTPINEQTLIGDTVKFVGTATLGIDHVDTDFLSKKNIAFASAQGSSKHSVAQYVLTAIATLRPMAMTTPITLGIVGLGNIGATLADYAIRLGWQVAGYDPFLPKSAINNSTFDEVLSISDVISLHTPLTKTGEYPTYHLIDNTAFGKMNECAMLINSARGQVVCEQALLGDVGRTGRQVVLDVFEHEPSVSDELLSSLVLATPHIAGYTLDGKLRGTDMIYQAFCQTFGFVPSVVLQDVLPNNPYCVDDWIKGVKQGNMDILPSFYDIKADDKALRAVNVGGADFAGVGGADFDRLRKDYQLRREWVWGN